MRYSLNEYSRYIADNSTCIEVYSNNETAGKLLALHLKNNENNIRIAECIGCDARSLPMPSELVAELERRIAASKCRVVVTGIDGYLSLLNKNNKNSFMIALQFRLEEQKINAAFMISKNYFDLKNFDNPKYENSMQVVNIVENGNPVLPPTVRIVSQKWMRYGDICKSWAELLERLGSFEPGSSESIDITLALNNYHNYISGLSESIVQHTDVLSLSDHFFGINGGLPQKTIECLLSKCQEARQEPQLFLEMQFGKSNMTLQLAIKRLTEMPNDELWLAYIWLLKKSIDKTSYLSKVLSENISYGNILRIYISEFPILVFGDIDSVKYSKERAYAIKELGGLGESFIIEFIGNANAYTNDVVACWLNCGTPAEKVEIVRRVSKSDLTTGLSHLWNGLYPTLENYLSNDFDYGNEEFNDYFDEYKILKLQSAISKDFIVRASTISLSVTFQKRDMVLSEIVANDNTALIIVDGMGVEYLPCILAMADQRKIKYESVEIGDSNLPTETRFNEIDEKIIKVTRLEPVKEIDTIAHFGKAKGEKNTPEQNIVAVFDALEKVINRVASALIRHDRVVLTADHGASRLAVIAYDKELIKTITDIKSPLDWRYSVAINGMKCPPEFEVRHDLENDIMYWVLRNYDRLPKQGAPINELHGGATLEERLVPIIIFSKTITETIKKKRVKQCEQLMEEKDFDLGV